MASEIEADVACNMKLVKRSYSTEPGWRLATFEEANDNLDLIKQRGLLKEWQTARLLDGWISGPRHNFQMGDHFRSCLGYMLLIQLHPPANYSSGNSDHASSRYEDVPLTLKGREVALLLCAQDWNFEVVYWLLNFWEKKEPFNPLDVREGNIPFSKRGKFEEMNRLICHMGRILGEERLPREKAMRRKFSDESVKEVMVNMGMSCWDKFSQEHKKMLGQTFLDEIDSMSRGVSEDEKCSKANWFREFASQEDTSDAIWNFLWYIVSSNTLTHIVQYRILPLALEEWKNEGRQTRRQRDFFISTAILFHLYEFVDTELDRIFEQACTDAAGDHDRQRFNDMLKNTSFSCYGEAGNYEVLNKILIFAVCFGIGNVVNKVLEWGAQPQVNLRPDRQNMALCFAIENNNTEIVRSLFDKCDSKEQFANAPNEEGMTALHWACTGSELRRPEVSICRMIVEYGGRADVGDNRGRRPLHYAVERGYEDIVDVLIAGEGNSDIVQSQDFNERMANMVTLKDKDGVSALDMAIKNNNIKLMIKLLSVSQESLDTYIDKVDSAKLLREFASQGNMEVVKRLLESGADPLACDEQGQTTLHHASMSQDDYKARKLMDLILEKCTSEEEKKKWVIKQDDMGKTALHVAAMKGHENLCRFLWRINNGILQIKDRDGLLNLRDEYIVDRSGLTALHVAASEGRMRIADLLLKESKKPKVYVRASDVFGQTALHKAAKGGHGDIIKVLLHWGAHPLLERDCDGRTVFHYFAQPQLTGENGKEVAELVLKKCGSDEMKMLLLWAPAAGLGTADQNLDDSPLKKFLVEQKKDITEKLKEAGKENNLLKVAACLGDIDLTKELLTRGAQIGDIDDQHWRSNLSDKEKDNADTVRRQLESIAEQGNDLPTTSDNLGRSDFAHGLAALLLNPYLKPPITVGISGTWGMGKSSLMLLTEGILLKTAAQLALLPSQTSSSEMSSFPGFKIMQHTEKGTNKYNQIERCIHLSLDEKAKKEGYSLPKFLNVYEAKYHHIFKSLAAMDSSGMFKVKGQQSLSKIDHPTKGREVSYISCSPLKVNSQQSQLENDPLIEGSVPAILTVRYNAWRYRSESEALAGMVEEITKAIEGILTHAQWLSTCFRNSLRKQKNVFWIEVVLPSILAILLAISFNWILWLVLNRHNIKEPVELKYASFPVALAISKKLMSNINPVSDQLLNDIKLPNHSEKLGYQKEIISDITFLKNEISEKPYWLCTVASYIRYFTTRYFKYSRESMPSLMPSANLRIIVFIDDLDRCQETIILQVLSIINLVLAVCEISVVLGMDKELIQRAIMKRHGNKSLKNSKLADKYLQKIIQLPLDLPDPSEEQSRKFLDRHLGVFPKQNKEGHSESQTYDEDDFIPEIHRAYNDLFSPIERSNVDIRDIFCEIIGSVTPISGEGNGSTETVDALLHIAPSEGIEGPDRRSMIVRFYNSLISKRRRTCHCRHSIFTRTTGEIQAADGTGEPKVIPMRELLFVRYSEGERDAFCHFQRMATDLPKLPREWKRFLAYHRLVWYIFVMNNETKHLDGWQVQLITWIFICWEFEENINILVKRWKEIDLLKAYEPGNGTSPPSLRAILEHCIKKEIEKMSVTSNGRDIAKHSKDSENKDPPTQKLDIEARDVSEGGDCSESSEVARPENLMTAVKGKSDELDKALLMKLDAQMQDLKELVNSQLAGKSEKRAEEKKLKLPSLRRMKSALGKYDVSMGGIQAFQRFRFYCEAGHLPWPLDSKEEENEDS